MKKVLLLGVLGSIYLCGCGPQALMHVAVSNHPAVRAHERYCAENGKPYSHYLIGWEHEMEGEYEEALKWYKLSANAGNSSSLRRLIWVYDPSHSNWGEWVEKSHKKVFNLRQKASGYGDECLQHELAHMYRWGIGIAQNDQLALKWYLKSAEQGYWPSQLGIARMYVDAGVSQSDKFVLAYAWMSISIMNYTDENEALIWSSDFAPGQIAGKDFVREDDLMNERNDLAAKMRAGQIALAEEWAKEMVRQMPNLIRRTRLQKKPRLKSLST